MSNSPPLGIVDFGQGRMNASFIFTIAPNSTWSMLEGGFSVNMTPSGIDLYEVTIEKSGQFCIGYDTQRVADWDNQTQTTLKGYSPNPSAFNTLELLPESDAPYDVLPYTDSVTEGPCPQ